MYRNQKTKDMKTNIIVHNWNHAPKAVVWEHVKKAIDMGILNNKLNEDKGAFYYNDYNNSGIEINITYKQRK